MSTRTLTCFLFPILFVQALVGQRNCATLEHWKFIAKTNPSATQSRALIERQTQLFASQPELRDAPAILIPVVVNVVYNTATENISDEQILEQIRVLNEDFGHINPDADKTWPQAASTGIQFQLANRTPDGTSTNGIRRRYTPFSTFSTYDDVKFSKTGGIDSWPTQQYLNIWVCNLDGDIMGYGQLPGGPAATDGVVVDFQFFGRYGHTKPPFDRGRTATHEVGHWLNLFHIWGDGDCSIDDMVADTPDSDDANHGCPKDAFSCGGKLMVQNFMDYTDDGCMNLFTAGQARRMQALFAAGGFRNRISSSPGISSPGQISKEDLCSDGRQNGDETGVDCGGSCVPCTNKVTCPTPIGIKQTLLGTKVTLAWEGVNAYKYLAEIRQLKPSVSKWASVVTANTSASVSGVRIGRTYEWRVRSICSAGDTSIMASTIFITRSNERLPEREASAIFPNPSKGTFYFKPRVQEQVDAPLQIGDREDTPLENQFTTSFILIKNTQGQLIKTQAWSGDATYGVQVDVPDLATGMYFVHWVDRDGKSLGQVHKLIIH
ncbi:M43 family zinc metalloprotease [Haliscomenobacter sp.]|uniref:M43 family zinc metalloprotease n=1 Tax=Haliscomenobacter sp. TaxID=2717303 RepID=UPI003364BC3F